MVKRNHRVLSALAVALVLVLALSAPAMAISSTMTYKSDDGYFTEGYGGSYPFSCTTGASTTKATASMSYGWPSATLSCSINAQVEYNGSKYTNNSGDAGNSAIGASVDNRLFVGGKHVNGEITLVVANYMIRSTTIATHRFF